MIRAGGYGLSHGCLTGVKKAVSSELVDGSLLVIIRSETDAYIEYASLLSMKNHQPIDYIRRTLGACK